MKKRIFSRFLALVLTALMLVGVLPIAVWAETSDFSYYTFYDDEGEYAVIVGYYGDGGYVTVPAEIDGLPVRQIAYGVFDSRRDIVHVTVSEGIEHLSGNVFSWSSVSSVSLPSTLIGISSQCFYYCRELTEITIPGSVTLLGNGLFEGCESLTDVYFEAAEPGENWDAQWADMCYANIWFDGVLRSECVQDDQFLYRVENKQATVLDYLGDYYAELAVVPETVGGATVTAIGADAFKDTYYLQEIVLPETVTVIANNAFISCGSLEKVNLPLGLTEIGYQAFMWCGNLQELRIPESVAYIGSNAFAYANMTLYFEAEYLSADWDENWQSEFYGSTVWGACVHRNETETLVEKTCTSDGYRNIVCDDCGEETFYRFYPASHDYDNGVCTVCGDELPMWELYDYWYDGEGIVINRYFGDDEHVVIPAEIDGIPVVALDSYVFNECDFIQSVEIPETVTRLGYAAFYYCTSLREITIPASVKFVSNDLFLGCESLTDIYCMSASEMKNWEICWFSGCYADIWAEGVLVNDCGTLDGYVYRLSDGIATILKYEGTETELVIPSEIGGCPVTVIYHSAFSGNSETTAVTIPDSVTSIGQYAFAWNYALTEITIPASVEMLDYSVFHGCTSLQNIYCEAASQPDNWSDEWASDCNASIYFDGVMTVGVVDGFRVKIENGEVEILGYVGDATEIIVPAELNGLPVTAIGECAFADLYDVTSITLPDTLVSIGSDAFMNCSQLTEITIPVSVQTVGCDLFWNCYNLQNIYCEAAFQPDNWDYDWANGCEASIWFDGVMTQGTIDNFRFELENGGAVITTYYGGENHVVVPSEIGGYPVIGIANGAFAYEAYMLSIILPDTLVWIGNEAFMNCAALGEITIPASVQTVGYDLFWNCTSLRNIYCEAASRPETWDTGWVNGCDATVWFDGVMTQGVIDDFKFVAENGEVTILNYVGNMDEVVIPAELNGLPVTAIGERAVAYLYNVTSITIPDSVTYISYDAFVYNGNLTEITIPASVEFMGSGVFEGCYSLENIYCEAASLPDSWSYDWASGCNASIWFDGVLTQGVIDGFKVSTENGEVTILDYVGDATELIIPAELNGLPVTRIEDRAFSDLYQVTVVSIPDSVTYIGYEVFAWCSSLTEITIPDSVLYMDYSVFWDCNNLQNIYCEAASQHKDWNIAWNYGCGANIWFDGVMTQGVIDGFKFVAENGEVTILGYVGDATELIIPAELNGLPVTKIEDNAFSDLYQVTAVSIPDSVTYIGYGAFSWCSSLTEITIPDSVTFIGQHAFAWNYALTEITIPEGVIEVGYEAFTGCEALENIYCEAAFQPENWNLYWLNGCNASVWFDGVLTIGVVGDFQVSTENGEVTILGYVGDAAEIIIPAELNGLPVTVIGDRAFSSRYGLTSVTIPDSVTSIDSYAFAWCESLTEITIPASVQRMDSDVFRGCGNLQNIYCKASERPMNWYSDWASGCNASVWFDGVLTQGVIDGFKISTENGEVEILDYIGDATELVIPAELNGLPVTSIGNSAFSSQYGLMSVTIPDSVTSISSYAFAWCESLTEIIIPDSVTFIGYRVFGDCYSLENIYCEAASLPDSWSYDWTSGCNASIWFDGVLTIGVIDGFKISTENGEVTILGYVGGSTDVVIPAELNGLPVTAIAHNAFANRYDLTSVTIPDSVTSIDKYAFGWCGSLTEITIPASVGFMGGEVFEGCYSLKNIYCEAVSQPDNWDYDWTGFCNASVWFDGVLTQGVIDGFNFSTENGEVTILGYVGESTDIVIPAELNGLPVTAIAHNAFANRYDLTSVTIPDSVTSIGNRAFGYCDALTEITIPESVIEMGYRVFYDCNSLENIYCEAAYRPDSWDYDWASDCNASIWFDGVLTQGVIDGFRILTENGEVTILGYVGDAAEIIIPAELFGCPVTSIGGGAFANQYGLMSVTIPDSVTFIGYEVFAWCESLTEITIPESVRFMESDVFRGCGNLQVIYLETNEIPADWYRDWCNGCSASVYANGVLTIGVIDGYYIKITDGEATILNTIVERVGELTVPDMIGGMPVTAIGNDAFADQYGLTSVTIPDSVTYIGSYAFAWCESLTEITIPESVRFMESDVFRGCGNLQAIYLEMNEIPADWYDGWCNGCSASVYANGVLTIGVIDGYYIEITDGEVTILNTIVERVGELTIPAEINGMPVTAIGNNAFADQYGLTSVTIPDSVTYIGYDAFAWCASLTEVTIPENVDYMGFGVFFGCTALENIYCEASEQPKNWNYGWANNCYANVWFDGELTIGTENGFRFKIFDGEVWIESYFGDDNELTIPAEIDGMPVVAIDSSAFAGMDQITSVVIPDSVVYICYEAFADCDRLIEITIPDSVQYMDADIFMNCDRLQAIYCQASERPEEWYEGWWSGCDAEVYFDGKLTLGKVGDFRVNFTGEGAVILNYVGKSAEVVIPDTIEGVPVVGIENSAFDGHGEIRSIVLPDGLKFIGYHAFAWCESLTEITIPASVVFLDNNVFRECSNLKNIYLAENARLADWSLLWIAYCDANVWLGDELITVFDGDYRVMLVNGGATILGYYGSDSALIIPETLGGMTVNAICTGAFEGMRFISSVTMPDTVCWIGEFAFAGCEALQSIDLSDNLQWIGYMAFAACTSLTEITIPGSVGYISEELFESCCNLNTVVLGEGIFEIGYAAFLGSGIQTIVLPSTLTVIQAYAFADCTLLTEITIPYSVQFIGERAFANTKNLEVIYCEAEDASNWTSFWTEGCNAEIVWGVSPCLHETTAEETEAPTCGRDGYIRTVCTDCGRVLTKTTLPATGEHEMELPAVGGADCEGWSITYYCKNCDHSEKYVVPATGHAYGKDGVCTKCGESTVELVISVGNASAKPGETFAVEVVLDHNAGFTWLELVPDFDPDVLELISVENGEVSYLSSNGEIYVWASASNATATGTLCTLIFAVKEDTAVRETAVSVSVSMCNSADGKICATAINGGVISTGSFEYGDANDDGKIDGKDATRLLRYLANLDPFTGESSAEVGDGADANGDGKIDGRDATRLLRYLANLDPFTGESSVTLGPGE